MKRLNTVGKITNTQHSTKTVGTNVYTVHCYGLKSFPGQLYLALHLHVHVHVHVYMYMHSNYTYTVAVCL